MNTITHNQTKTRSRVLDSISIWSRASDLLQEVDTLCRTLPEEGIFNKRKQLAQSALGVWENMSEGHTIYYFQAKVEGFERARKEANKTQRHIRGLERKKHISSAQAQNIITQYQDVINGINGLIEWAKEKN